MNYKNKRVLVCGMARSGVSAALLLKRLGAVVAVQDLKEADKLGELPSILAQHEIPTYLGKNPDAIIKNFDLLIVSPGIPCDLPFFNKAFDLLKPTWGEIELAYSVCKNPIVAITGTNGKTTTTAMVSQIMEQFQEGSVAVGNIGTPFCDKVLDLPENAFVVAEISSFQLETAFTFRPHIAAILNIAPDHLNRHKTFENYIDIKEKIFAKQTEQDFTVLNADDPHCLLMAEKTKGQVVFFSRKKPLSQGVFLEGDNIVARFKHIDETILNKNELRVVGNHNIENAMAAIAICLAANVPVSLIQEGLRNFKAVPHRIELVAEIDGVPYYNDSKATNVDSAIKGLEAMDRPIILIGGGQDKQCSFSDWVACFKDKVKYLVVLGETADTIIETCKAYGFMSYEKVNTLYDAVSLCHAKAQKGDVVLFSPACASYDMFDNYEQRGDMFKEFVMRTKKEV